MMCPLDSDKRAFLVYAVCRGRRLALNYFVRALKALHNEAMNETKNNKLRRKISFRSYLIVSFSLRVTGSLHKFAIPISNNGCFH